MTLSYIVQFVLKNKLGKVTNAEGGYWITPDNLRAPDIAFYDWEKNCPSRVASPPQKNKQRRTFPAHGFALCLSPFILK